MSWLKENISATAIMKVVTYLIAGVVFIMVLDFRVQTVESTQNKHINDYEQYRYQTIPDTYMRKDVMDQVLNRLERIERKIDTQNAN